MYWFKLSYQLEALKNLASHVISSLGWSLKQTRYSRRSESLEVIKLESKPNAYVMAIGVKIPTSSRLCGSVMPDMSWTLQ